MKFIHKKFDRKGNRVFQVDVHGHKKCTFTIARYGSLAKAERAAEAYVVAYLSERKSLHLLEEKITGNHRPKSQRCDSRYILGINRDRRVRRGRVEKGWRAAIYLEGKQMRRTFSIQKHGEVGAFLKACQLRYEYYGELIVAVAENLPVDMATLKKHFPNILD